MTRSAGEIQDWLVARVSDLLGVPPGEVDPREPVTRYGLDSVAAITLAGDLEQWLGCRFQENPLDAHPTIEQLSHYLADRTAR